MYSYLSITMSLPNTPDNDIQKPSVDNQNTPPPQQPTKELDAKEEEVFNSMSMLDFLGLTEDMKNVTLPIKEEIVEVVLQPSREKVVETPQQSNEITVSPERESHIKDLCTELFRKMVSFLSAYPDVKFGGEAVLRFQDYLDNPGDYTLNDLFHEWGLFESVFSYCSRVFEGFYNCINSNQVSEIQDSFSALGLVNAYENIHDLPDDSLDADAAENDSAHDDVIEEDLSAKQSREILQGVLSAFSETFKKRHILTTKALNLERMGMNFETRAARIELVDHLEKVRKGGFSEDIANQIIELERTIKNIENMYNSSPVLESDAEFSERVLSILRDKNQKMLKSRILSLQKSIEEDQNYAADKMGRISTLQKTAKIMDRAKRAYSIYAQELKKPVGREYLASLLDELRDFKTFVAAVQNEIALYEKRLQTNNLSSDERKEIAQYITERRIRFDAFVDFFRNQNNAIRKICTLLDQELF